MRSVPAGCGGESHPDEFAAAWAVRVDGSKPCRRDLAPVVDRGRKVAGSLLRCQPSRNPYADTAYWHHFDYAGPALTTRSACENAALYVYRMVKSGTSWVSDDNSSHPVHGTWHPPAGALKGWCDLSLTVKGMSSSKQYKFAVSSRPAAGSGTYLPTYMASNLTPR